MNMYKNDLKKHFHLYITSCLGLISIAVLCYVMLPLLPHHTTYLYGMGSE